METSISAEELQDMRASFNGLGKIYNPADGVDMSKETISGVVCYIFTPAQAHENRLLIYAHGGGFILGGIESHMALMTHLARATQTTIIFAEYRLAPENPFPMGIHDFLNVYTAIKSRNGHKKIFVGGDSAGGGLIVSFIHELQKKALSLPDGIAVISPWLDLQCDTESYQYNRDKDPILNKEEILKYARLYVGNTDVEKANPSDITFQTFPPNLIAVAKDELLYEEGYLFHKKVKSMQSESYFHGYENATHVWPMTDIGSEATVNLFNVITDFLNSQMN